MAEYSIFEPRTMGKLVERLPKIHTFLKSTFFKRAVTFGTKSIDVDFKKGNRALAPFVHPEMGSKTIPNAGYQTRTFTPALIAPSKITTAGNLEDRMAGENICSGTTPAERAVKKLADDLSQLNEMVTRREEWMIAQALFTGLIPIVGEGLSDKVDFKFTNKAAITDAKQKWSADTSDPIGDLQKWRTHVQKTGFVNCNVCVMASNVANAFINHKKVQTLLDIRNYEIAVIKPRELPSGASYVGTISSIGLDIYTYNEWYLDNWTDSANPVQNPLVPDNTLLLISTTANYSMYYGAITQLDGKGGSEENFVTYEGARIPKSWVAHDPDRRFVQIQSKPLPVPHEVDSWYVATVL